MYLMDRKITRAMSKIKKIAVATEKKINIFVLFLLLRAIHRDTDVANEIEKKANTPIKYMLSGT